MRLYAAIGICLITAACTSQVTEAYCNACGERSYSETECRAWADEAGCEASTFVPDAEGECHNGCTFRDCIRSPRCGPREPPVADAASPVGGDDDAALPDAACGLAPICIPP